MVASVAPLKIGRFRALWLASILSNVGAFLQAVAASWLMLEITGSAAWVGLIAASTTLPILFLALAAGAVADLVDRTKVLLASQVLMGVAATAMSALWYLDLITPGRLLSLGLLLGVGVAFSLPAWQAMVPDLVPREMVADAVALNSVAFNVARSVGPALGGAVVVAAGPGAGFALNALSYLGVMAAVVALRSRLDPPTLDQTSMANAIALGVRFARFTPVFRRLLALVSLFALTSAVVQAILPNVTEELGAGAGTYGVLLGVMGVGALVGGLTRGQLTNRLGRRSLQVAIAGFGLAGLVLGLAPDPGVAAGALLVAGACWVWTLSTLNATAQLMSPAWVRGRAMSLYTLAFVGFIPVGSILAGVVAAAIGAQETVLALSAAGVALGLGAGRFGIPVLTEVRPPEFTREVELGDHVATAEGGPVMVVSTWVIDPADLEDFLAALSELRLVRLRTGAYRWRLYRNAGNPRRLTEVFLVASWEDHLAQHRRIDDLSAEVIRRSRAFDRADGPITHHLVAVDVLDPEDRPDWDALLAAHGRLHETDGSIPLPAEG